MQRVRIGLTGLAIVFLVVLLAAAVFGLSRDESVAGGPGGAAPASAGNVAAGAQEPPREPLAELGVTPGGTPEENVGNAAAPPPVPR